MVFIYDNIEYPIEIIRKKGNKNTYFRIKKDLSLYITTNLFTNDKTLLKMITENKTAIENMYKKQLEKQENNAGFSYLGKKYDIIYVTGEDISFGEKKVFIGKDIDLGKWYKKQATKVFKDCFDKCYNQFTRTIPYPRLRIRKMTSRWGVCNYKDVIITLNLELIKRDTACLEYVIYHELSHLIEANHSDRFWKVVEENYPNYKKVRQVLKKY